MGTRSIRILMHDGVVRTLSNIHHIYKLKRNWVHYMKKVSHEVLEKRTIVVM